MATLAPPGPSRPGASRQAPAQAHASSSAAAATTSRAAPARTLRQPLALNVAERASGVVAPQKQSDAVQLRGALERRVGIARRAEKWMDKAMEEVLGVGDFQKALSYMHGAQYTEVQHERHLNSLCAYPLCDKTPAAPYRSQKRFLVSTARRTITEKEGNDEEAFCSRKCAARSAWVASSLGTEAAWIRGKVEPIELLEDKEAKGEVSWGGRRGDVLVWNKKGGEVAATSAPVQPPQATPAKSTPMFTATIAPRDPPSSISKLPTPHAAPAPAPIPAPTQTLSTPDQMSDLIASLSIVERETPGSRPAPPGAPAYVEQGRVVGGSVASLPLPLPSGGVLANSAVNIGGIGGIGPASVSVSTPKADRRAASSLLNMGGLKSTATTVLAAAEKLQPQGDSSDESESEEEWAKEMGWGRGDEVDAVFAEAARAREMMAEK